MLFLSNAEIRSYAEGISADLYPYFCTATGELAESLWYMIRATLSDWLRHRVVHCWKRTRSWQ